MRVQAEFPSLRLLGSVSRGFCFAAVSASVLLWLCAGLCPFLHRRIAAGLTKEELKPKVESLIISSTQRQSMIMFDYCHKDFS